MGNPIAEIENITPKPPLLFARRWPPSNTSTLWPTPCITPNRSSDGSLLHSYATNSPLVTMGRPTFALKLPNAVDLFSNPITCFIPGLIRPTSQIASISDQPFCHNALETVTLTHRPTDSSRESSVCRFVTTAKYGITQTTPRNRPVVRIYMFIAVHVWKNSRNWHIRIYWTNLRHIYRYNTHD